MNNFLKLLIQPESDSRINFKNIFRSRIFQRADAARDAPNLHRRRSQDEGSQEGRALRDDRRQRQRRFRRSRPFHQDRSKVATQELAGRTFFRRRYRDSAKQ